MVNQVNIGTTIFDGKDATNSRFGCHIKIHVALPPVPFAGLEIVIEPEYWTVNQVRWDAAQGRFFCVLEKKYQQVDIEGIGFDSFQEWVNYFGENGWSCSKVFSANQ
jgi:hypothetical protein